MGSEETAGLAGGSGKMPRAANWNADRVMGISLLLGNAI
jgi:hypothetical protein